MAKSPVSIPFTTDGVEIAVKDATSTPTDARGQIMVGKDGSTTRFVNVDSSGRMIVVGIGTAGSPAGGVVSVQGVSGGTVIPVSDGGGSLTIDGTVTVTDGSGSLTVDGTVTANIGTTGGLALDTTLTGGSQKAIARGGAKGATAAADVTSTAEGSDHQALDVQIYHGATAINPTAIRALTSSDVVTSAQGAAAALSGYWPVRHTDGTNTMPTGDVAARGVFHRITDGTNTAAVKAASTAAATTDPAMVVALSPNSANPLSANRDGTGTITALDGTVTANTIGCSTVVFNVTGTWSATLTFEATADGSGWFLVNSLLFLSGSGTSISDNITANGAVTVNCGGYSQVRVRASAFTSGTASIAWSSGSGTNLQGLALDQLGRIITAPAGASADVTPGLAPGYVSTAALTRVVVRSTAYTEQTTNAQRSIVSANAADAAAGTGARTVKITYYSATFTGPHTETITLNGTTPVNTVNTNICYIEKMEVLTVGSGGSNAGIISLRTTTGGGGSTFASIAVGDNETFYAHHYVATGITCYVTGMSVGHNGTVVGSGALFIVRAQALNVANSVDDQIGDFVRLYGQSSSITRVWGTALEVPGPARISVLVTPESSSSLIYRASMDFYDQ